MRILGGFLRYLLNINTVWGLMILVSFGACVVQHYLPTTTLVPATTMHPGGDTLTIRIATGTNKDAKSFDYPVTAGVGGLALPSEQRAGHKDRPWLISAPLVNGHYLLKWDYDGYGKYEVAVNGLSIGHGKLVTLQALTDAAFDYAQKGFDIALGLVAAMVLFLGLMKVGEDAGIVQLVASAFHPIIRYLFPEVPKDHPANGAILMNVTTSILGLGNAATPFGIKAMQELQKLNPHPEIATDSEVMLLAYNTAGLALLPTTLLAVRKAAGCSDPFEIIGPCMITGAVSTVLAIVLSRVLAKLPIFSVAATLAEVDTTVASLPEAEREPVKNADETATVAGEEGRS